MPKLSYSMERMPSGGRNQISEGRIFLDSEKIIEFHDMWRICPQTQEELEYGRLFGAYWPSDNDPNRNAAVLREIVLQHEGKYESPEVPADDKFNPWYKGLLVFADGDLRGYHIGHFLDASAYSSLVAPGVAEIRVCTPNGNFIVDYHPQEGKEKREVAVLTHRNIGDLVTELTMQTATALMPHSQLKPQLEAIYNEIMGDNYSVPLRKTG